MRKTSVLVTGASGFIGKALVHQLLEEGQYQIKAIVRDPSRFALTLKDQVETLIMQDINQDSDWNQYLKGVDVIIHTAARVHIMQDKSEDPLHEFRKANVEGSLNLARQAAKAGVKRFIFLSSIKVNGEETKPHKPFTPEIKEIPQDPYALSKYEAEQGLLALAKQSGMEVVIIRPPLVYGPGVKGNFASLISWLKKGIPLPLGAIHNKRSYVALINLIDLIITCIHHPKAANEIFLVSDGEDVSTTVLLKEVGKAFDLPARLIPIPSWFLQHLGLVLGQKEKMKRLCGNLQVDISKTCNLLDWAPIASINQALNETAEQPTENLW